MKIQNNPAVHLTYCLNIHPGETWQDNFSAIKNKALAVKAQVCPGKPFGLGLRLGNESVASLLNGDPAAQGSRSPAHNKNCTNGAALVQLKRFLADNGLYVFTINGFPYGSFHGTRVKENVYSPDWRAVERLDYTVKLADVLKDLLPVDMEGSISTVPGSYKHWIKSGSDVSEMVKNLAECARHLDSVYMQTGKIICLALEPEPDCYLETTSEVIAFFENHLFRDGVDYLVTVSGVSRGDAARIIRRHLGVCFDTCHIALQFEDLENSLGILRRHGIRVPKVQLSSAIRIPVGRQMPVKLGPFVDPVYLHQVKVRNADGSVVSYNDLSPGLLEKLAGSNGGEVRAHFHVPLYFSGDGELGSTSASLTPGFFKMLLESENHLEIETYTYNVLPAELRSRDVVLSIADEFKWLQEKMAGGS